MRHLGRVLGQGLVVVLLRGFRIQAQVELVLPAEIEARLAERIVARAGPRMALGHVGRMGRYLVRDDPLLHVVAVRQAQVLLGRDVAQHGRAHPADHGRADGAGDVVVAGGDVDGQRPERVERRLVAGLELLGHVGLDHVHGHVAGALDHGLHIVLPGHLGQLAQRAQLGELRLVVGVGRAAGPQAVAEAEGHVVLLHDVADVLEVRVQEALAVVRHAPLGHDGAAARDDARAPLGREVDEGQPHARVDGEVVHALLRLLDERVAEDLPGQVLGDAAHLLQRLVDRHGADGHGAVAHDPVARGVDVLAGGEVHHVVRAPADRPNELLDLFLDAGGDGRVADVGVDLDLEVAPDRHRLDLGVVDVGRDDGPTARHLVAHELRRDDLRDARAHRVAGQALLAGRVLLVLRHPFAAAVLAQGHVLHLGRDDALPGVVHLRHVGPAAGAQGLALQRGGLGAQHGQAGGIFGLAAIVQRLLLAAFVALGVAAAFDPGAAHAGEAPPHIDVRRGVGVGAGRVIDADLLAIGERDIAHGHAQVGAAAGQVVPGGGGKGFAGQREQLGELVGGVHAGNLLG